MDDLTEGSLWRNAVARTEPDGSVTFNAIDAAELGNWIKQAYAVLRDCRGPINAWPQYRDTLLPRIDALLPSEEDSRSSYADDR